MKNQLLLFYIIGAVILMILLIRDFKKKIFKPKKAGRYYIALCLFSFINIFIYTSLCAIFLGIDPARISLVQDPDFNLNLTPLQLFQPVLISLMYFGTGIAKFKFGGKNIDFYQLLLNAFQDLIEITVLKEEEIRNQIAECAAEYATLKSRIIAWRETAIRRKWDSLNNEWQDMETDINMLDEQVAYLNEVDSQLNEPVNIDYVKENINRRIRETRASQIQKLKRYITKFILTNIKNENDIDFILNELGAKPNLGRIEPNPVVRCFVLCVTFGLLIGPVYGLYLERSVVQYGWIGAISVGVFGLIFSYVRYSRKNASDLLVSALVSGGLAGLVGHAVFMAATSFADKGELSINYEKLYFGVEFGIGVGLVLHLYRNYMLKTPIYFKYLLLSLSGGVLFVALGFLNGMCSSRTFADGTAFIFMGFMFFFGVVVTTGMAFGLNVFNQKFN